MAKAQPLLERRADGFGQDDLPGRIAGDLRGWRRNRQESRGASLGLLLRTAAPAIHPEKSRLEADQSFVPDPPSEASPPSKLLADALLRNCSGAFTWP